ncbi:hypothetical protein [Methanobrevibacter gottschalkii]|uniref:hypothetical protein n=1 Tax=Methanobrevibacter gottschalkii TaxID=190974 RepID=UPI0038CF6693
MINTYNQAVLNGDNVELIIQSNLFEYNEWDYIVVDAGHYIDYGMFKIANKICELLER